MKLTFLTNLKNLHTARRASPGTICSSILPRMRICGNDAAAQWIAPTG